MTPLIPTIGGGRSFKKILKNNACQIMLFHITGKKRVGRKKSKPIFKTLFLANSKLTEELQK